MRAASLLLSMTLLGFAGCQREYQYRFIGQLQNGAQEPVHPTAVAVVLQDHAHAPSAEVVAEMAKEQQVYFDSAGHFDGGLTSTAAWSLVKRNPPPPVTAVTMFVVSNNAVMTFTPSPINIPMPKGTPVGQFFIPLTTIPDAPPAPAPGQPVQAP